MLSAPALPLGLMSLAGSSGLPSGAANQRWPLLQADCQTCCKAATTFVQLLSSLLYSVVCTAGEPELAFLVFGVFFRLVALSACLLLVFLGYFYSFPGLHFLLCILFLLPNFLPTIWMLSKIVS